MGCVSERESLTEIAKVATVQRSVEAHHHPSRFSTLRFSGEESSP